LARHKTSAMTDRYTHVRLNDERAALQMLPDLTARPSDEQVRATGTDDAIIGDQQGYSTPRIHSSESGARFGALCGTNRQISAQVGANKNRVPAMENAVLERGRRVSNPQPSDRQAVAGAELGSFGADGAGEVSSLKCQVSSGKGPVSGGGSDFPPHT
jgi:hypothetical protein